MAKIFGRLKINSTVLACAGWTLSDAVNSQVIQHDGTEFADAAIVGSAAQQLDFTGAPLAACNTLFGFGSLNVTTLEAYGIDIDDDGSLKTTGDLLDLEGVNGANAFGFLTGFSVQQDGVWLADGSIIILSGDGATDPLQRQAAQTVPAVSQPQHYTLGAATMNNSAIDGLVGVTGAISRNVQTIVSDGDKYPTAAFVNQTDTLVSAQFESAKAARDAATSIGTGVTATTTFGMPDVAQATGVTGGGAALTMTIARGHILPDSLAGNTGGTVQHGLSLRALSNDGTSAGISIA